MKTSYPMLHKLRNASRLSPQDWLFFIEAWFWLLIFDIGLRTRPFSELQAYAARLTSQSMESSAQTRKLICALQAAVDRARYNHIYPMTCLRRSLAMQTMLSERGINTELKLGVRKEADQLNAHAWIEYKGKAVGEPDKFLEQYSQLIRSNVSSGC